MGPSRIYLDTSVYLGILLGEVAARQVIRLLSKKILCSSTLLLIETERNLVRLSRERILSAGDYHKAMDQLKDDCEKFLLRDVTMDLCLTGVFPAVRIPRSSDLAHLRTALWFQKNGAIEAFLTLDEAQKEAAKDLGLPVLDIC